MKCNKLIIMLLTLFLAGCMALGANAAPDDYNLSLEAIPDAGTEPQTQFRQGDILYLDIVLDNTAGVAGTAFTMTHDSNKVTGPATDADGFPVDPNAIISSFPFSYTRVNPPETISTHRENASETDKVYFAGTAIDPNDGGGLYDTGSKTLFTIKYEVKITDPPGAPNSTHTFTLAPTELFNLDAGYGSDNNGNETYDEGIDTKDPVAVLVGAIPDTDGNWGGDLNDDFPDLTGDLGQLPSLEITILPCLDNNGDNVCDLEVPPFNSDVDGNQAEEPLKDGIMIVRSMFNFPSPNLCANAMGDGATRTCEEIEQYIAGAKSSLILDVDGNGIIEPLKDGIMVVRFMFNFPSPNLCANAMGDGATRTCEEIAIYIDQNM